MPGFFILCNFKQETIIDWTGFGFNMLKPHALVAQLDRVVASGAAG